MVRNGRGSGPVLLLVGFLLSTCGGLSSAGAEVAFAAPKLTDQAISDQISRELTLDPGVVSAKVDVKTAEGIVTLTGQVDNILAKERAARIAETVKGVRSVVNRIEVDPIGVVSGRELEQDVNAALRADPATNAYGINVAAENGHVTLTGIVASYQEKELAETVAKGVQGVQAVDNQIRVAYRVDRSDEEIRHDIEQALRWHLHLDHALIEVAVQAGNVALTGTVGSAAERRMAASESWVAGVESVDSSELSVAYWARDPALRADKFVVDSRAEIQQAVRDALARDPRVPESEVQVEIVGSMVVLRGSVDHLKAKRAAESDARHTVGVAHVENRIKVRDREPRTDAQIAEDIRQCLLRDPYVERFEVIVEVLDGIAFLYGYVDTRFEKSRASEVTSRVSGVLRIENQLRVAEGDPPFYYNAFVDDWQADRSELVDYEPRAPRLSDEEIQRAIESEFWWSPFVDSDAVTVTVEEGVARLTGRVDSWSERRALTENAYEGGATLVDNDVEVIVAK